MRRVIVILAALSLLLAIPFVSAQPAPICGNNIVEGFEQCDGADATNCLNSICNVDCTCTKEAEFVLFDLALGHNLLFSKVMDLLHTIKDLLFQLEIKTIEIQLTDFNCDQQPVSFWLPSSASPYGKLNEIDNMMVLLIQSLQKGVNAGGNFGTIDISGAQSLLSESETCLSFLQFREAFECKCLAYRNSLLGLTDSSVTCNSCVP